MTDDEYYEKMNRTNHSNTCSWGWDQYWWECDCSAIPVAELKAERERRASSLSRPQSPPAAENQPGTNQKVRD